MDVIKIDLTEQETIKGIMKHLEHIKKSKKNYTGKVVTFVKETKHVGNGKHVLYGYRIQVQSRDTLWTGNNEIICDIQTDSIANEHYFISTDDGETLTNDEACKIVLDLIK